MHAEATADRSGTTKLLTGDFSTDGTCGHPFFVPAGWPEVIEIAGFPRHSASEKRRGDPYGRGIRRILAANFNNLKGALVRVRITFVPPHRPTMDAQSILQRGCRSKPRGRKIGAWPRRNSRLDEGRAARCRNTAMDMRQRFHLRSKRSHHRARWLR